MAERTLIWDRFDYIFEAERRRIKPVQTYRNPLLLALEYKKLLNTPGIGSQTRLAQKVGVSRVRISQFLRLLKLPPDIQRSVIRLGDPLPSREITERKLRMLLSSSQPR
jgi:ParB-like chromosome segregation protein Spo0J